MTNSPPTGKRVELESGEVLGFRVWWVARRDGQFVLRAYFTDYVWETAKEGGGETAAPSVDIGDWINSDGIGTEVGYSASADYDQLEEWVPDEGWTCTIHGAVALSGTVLADPFLRAQSARVLAFRDELPCAACHEGGEWRAGAVALCAEDSMAWSACDLHWPAERERIGFRPEDPLFEILPSQKILDSLSARYDVPLLSLAGLQQIGHGGRA